MKVVHYSNHCPNCNSEDFIMIGDPEYNDKFYCKSCLQEFGSFISRRIP